MDLLCDECRNKSLCKWSDSLKDQQEYVNKAPVISLLSPVSINVSCKSFEKKKSKQDGIYFR